MGNACERVFDRFVSIAESQVIQSLADLMEVVSLLEGLVRLHNQVFSNALRFDHVDDECGAQRKRVGENIGVKLSRMALTWLQQDWAKIERVNGAYRG